MSGGFVPTLACHRRPKHHKNKTHKCVLRLVMLETIWGGDLCSCLGFPLSAPVVGLAHGYVHAEIDLSKTTDEISVDLEMLDNVVITSVASSRRYVWWLLALF